MDCLLESLAGVYIAGMRYVAPQNLLPDSDDDDTNSNLESCLSNLRTRESELSEGIARLGKEAVQCKRVGDLQGAKSRMQERHRFMKRVERLRSSSHMITSQIDLLRNQQLDRELMQSLKLSASTLKKSGATLQVKTAEDVMSEFEEQFHEVNELSSVLSKPIAADFMDMDFEQELAELEAEVGPAKDSHPANAEARPSNAEQMHVYAPTPTPSIPISLPHSFDRPVAVSNAFERPAPFEPVSLVTPVRGAAANHMVAAA